MFSKKKKDPEPDAAATPVTPDPAETLDADAPANEADDAAPTESADAVETDASDESATTTTSGNEELLTLKDRYTRLMADFDNFRKRQLREREEWVKRANEICSVTCFGARPSRTGAAQAADPLRLSSASKWSTINLSLCSTVTTWCRWMRWRTLDPTYHEALAQASSDTVPADVVMEQYRRGWLLGAASAPAQMIVSSVPPSPRATMPNRRM